MPTIKDFGSFRITMYFIDHGTPHFHVVGPDFKASIAIGDGRLIIGAAPAKVLKTAGEWAAENRGTLETKWKELNK